MASRLTGAYCYFRLEGIIGLLMCVAKRNIRGKKLPESRVAVGLVLWFGIPDVGRVKL